MLKRKYRLGRERFDSARSFYSQLFTLKIKDNGLLFNRFGIITSKKLDRKAVIRNRIKRLISSCIEELFKDIKPGNDMLLIAKKEAATKNRKEILVSMMNVFKKEGLI